MLHRIRLALQNGSMMKLGGRGGMVEVDETFIGSLSHNMRKSRKTENYQRHKRRKKTAVKGLLIARAKGAAR